MKGSLGDEDGEVVMGAAVDPVDARVSRPIGSNDPITDKDSE